jgi:hypothetical protein
LSGPGQGGFLAPGIKPGATGSTESADADAILGHVASRRVRRARMPAARAPHSEGGGAYILLIRFIVSLAGHKAVNGYVDCYLKKK